MLTRKSAQKYQIISDPGRDARIARRAVAVAFGFALAGNLAVLIAGVRLYFASPHAAGAKLNICGGEATDAIGVVAGILCQYIGVPITIWAFFKIAKASRPLFIVLAVAVLLLDLTPMQLNAAFDNAIIASHPAGITASGCSEQ